MSLTDSEVDFPEGGGLSFQAPRGGGAGFELGFSRKGKIILQLTE